MKSHDELIDILKPSCCRAARRFSIGPPAEAADMGTASAQSNWDAMHPRRAEVNFRLAN